MARQDVIACSQLRCRGSFDLDGPLQAMVGSDQMMAMDLNVMAAMGSTVVTISGSNSLKVDGRRRLSGEGLYTVLLKFVSLRAIDGQSPTDGQKVEASAEGRPEQSSRITFDKDNPAWSVFSGAAALQQQRIASPQDQNLT